MPKLRKIHIDQARIGMFVADLERSWGAHPFWLSRFAIRDPAQIVQLRQEGIREFYIDIDKGVDIAANDSLPASTPAPQPPVRARRPQPLAEAVPQARAIVQRTECLTRDLLQDARIGQKLDIAALHGLSSELAESLDRNALALRMVTHMYSKDEYTFRHSVSVGLLLMILQHHLGAPHQVVVEAGMGGILHDIGKTRVPDTILNKPGALDAAERSQMKRHVDYSAAILDENGIHSPIIRAIALQHHERFDGGGYPRGLAGSAISVYGRQAAIIDVYDALTSDRCYHQGMPAPLAMKRIFAWGGQQFDPAILREVVRCFGIYPPGTLVRLASEQLAVVKQHSDGELTRPEVIVCFDIRRNRRCTPHSVDLAKRYGAYADDYITGYEHPDQWRHILPDLDALLLSLDAGH